MSANLLTISQASTILGVHPDTLRRWERQGLITSVRFGNRKDRRYAIEEINHLVEKGISPIVEGVKNPAIYFKNCSTILFDVSDTLISPYPSRGAVFESILRKRNIAVNPDEIETEWQRAYNIWEKEKLFSDESIVANAENRRIMYSKLNADVLRKVLKNNYSEALLLEIGREVFETITSSSKCWKKNDFAQELLEKARLDQKRIGIIDNWNKNFIKILRDLDLEQYFEIIISGGELGMRKPSKELFTHGLNLLRTKPSDAIYIGNRYIDDVIGPMNAGIQPILYDPLNLSTNVDIPRIASFKELL